MTIVTTHYNRTQIIKLRLLNTGVLLSLVALIPLPSRANILPSHRIIYLAELNDCINDISEGFSVETQNYFVGICLKDRRIFYTGRTKKSTNHIVLPATYNKKTNSYIAKNGNYTYTLDMKNKQFIINLPNNRRVIEKVINEFDS